MIRRLTFAALLIASPAWGAGNVSEESCDNLGAGLTWLCSEPFT